MQIRIGILSAALISHDFIVSLKNLDPNHYKIVAVAATNLKSAQKFAKEHNISKAYGTYEELAKDDDVQLVYIGNRNMYHYAATKLCIENKKHVLVEKPMTIEAETTRELFELGQKHGVFVMEALWSRWVPGYQKIREIIKSGEIGDVLQVSAHFLIHASGSHLERMMYKRYGGGITFDLGVYALNSIFEGVGYTRPKNLKAFGRLAAPGESETSVSAILDFPGEVTATMMLTARLGDEKYLDDLQQVIYVGTKGYIKINDWINCPRSIIVNGKKIDTNIKDTQTGYNWKNSGGLAYQFEEARKCIMENRLTSDLHKPENSILLAETMRKVIAEVGAEVIETPKDLKFTSV